jgi:hypothetical protein
MSLVNVATRSLALTFASARSLSRRTPVPHVTLSVPLTLPSMAVPSNSGTTIWLPDHLPFRVALLIATGTAAGSL